PMLAGPYAHFPNNHAWNIASFTAQDSQFRGGAFYIAPNNPSQSITWKNNLFERVATDFYHYSAITLLAQNNLFKDGSFTVSQAVSSNALWTVTDNLFDKTTISQGSLSIGNHHNGYVTNCTTLNGSSGNDVTNSSPNYQSSWLGKWYQPTNS